MLYGEPQTSQDEMINLLKIESDKKSGPFPSPFLAIKITICFSNWFVTLLANDRQTSSCLLLSCSFFCCFVLVTTPQFFRGITPLSQSFKHHSIESKSLCLPRNLILRSVCGSKQSQLQAQPSWCASASVHSLIPLQDISHLSY